MVRSLVVSPPPTWVSPTIGKVNWEEFVTEIELKGGASVSLSVKRNSWVLLLPQAARIRIRIPRVFFTVRDSNNLSLPNKEGFHKIRH